MKTMGLWKQEEEEEDDSEPVIDTFEGYAKKVRAAAAVMAADFTIIISTGLILR